MPQVSIESVVTISMAPRHYEYRKQESISLVPKNLLQAREAERIRKQEEKELLVAEKEDFKDRIEDEKASYEIRCDERKRLINQLTKQ